MNKKTFITAAVLALLGYFAYDFWQKRDQEKFCSKMEQCANPDYFRVQYIDFTTCRTSRAGHQGSRAFKDCDEGMECSGWLACGLGQGELGRDFRDKKRMDEHVDGFEQVSPHLKD